MKHLIKGLALAYIFAEPTFAANIDGLLVDLSGNDEHARAVARQMLPRDGYGAVPKLLGLLRSDNPNVWWAANAVLKDVLNGLTEPARLKQRQAAAEQLLAMLTPAETPEVKDRVMRLLPLAVPAQKCDLAPLDLYVRHTSPLINPFFRKLLPVLEPTHNDPVLRKFPNAHEL